MGIGSQRVGGVKGLLHVLTCAGPGMKHDVQRAFNVRNLNRATAMDAEQADYLDHKGSYEPKPRLRDMDVQGIDQVMVIPSDIDTYPWLQGSLGAKAFCKAYNGWAHEFCQEDPERLYFAAMLPLQNPKYATEELYRVAEQGCRVGLVRPMDAMGNYPIQPKFEPLWSAMEEAGVVYGMHPFPAAGSLKPPGLHRTIFRRRAHRQDGALRRVAPLLPHQRAELPGRSLDVGRHHAHVRLL